MRIAAIWMVLVLGAGPFAAGNALAEGEVYRWVDENCEVHYSETLPPDFQDQGHDVLNERGIVVDEGLKLTPEVEAEATSPGSAPAASTRW